jgi:3-oxoacyl-[acyl-carrier protein] reductase
LSRRWHRATSLSKILGARTTCRTCGGITVNAIAPGPLDTPMVHRTVPADRMAQLIAGVPVGALGDPTFVANMAARLCARDASFVTGATWNINGGLYMR